MLSKCANPACSARFLYLHQGRVFRFDIGISPARDPNGRTRRQERYWLCGDCVQVLTLRYEHGTVVVRPVRLELPADTTRAAAAA